MGRSKSNLVTILGSYLLKWHSHSYIELSKYQGVIYYISGDITQVNNHNVVLNDSRSVEELLISVGVRARKLAL